MSSSIHVPFRNSQHHQKKFLSKTVLSVSSLEKISTSSSSSSSSSTSKSTPVVITVSNNQKDDEYEYEYDYENKDTKGRQNQSKERQNQKISIKQMRFLGIQRVVTKAIPAAPTEILNEFFSKEHYRNLLFPNNDAMSYKGTISKELIDLWTKEAQLGGGEGPTVSYKEEDGVILINSNEQQQSIFRINALLQMPGLKIISESTIGMKLLLPTRSSSNSSSNIPIHPEYQFTLLESNLKPKGPAPLVWLFNKLTQYRDSTSSFTKVRVEPLSSSAAASSLISNEANQIVFVTDARLETKIHLPSKILKVLPSNVNLSKYEKQGSASIHQLLEKELEPALNSFCDAFCIFRQKKGY